VVRYWCELALVDDEVVAGVLVEVDGGVISALTAGVDRASAPSDAVRLAGLVIPGMANAHSHAFHRALRGHVQVGTGSFWTWRDDMYALAAALTPESYRDLATAVYGEMLMAGITAVGEFHYLHHDSGGVLYDDPNAMGVALAQAASAAGVRLTLLDTCYLAGGIGIAPNAVQQRFSDGSASAWAARVDLLGDGSSLDGDTVVGAAIHSVRAVPREAMGEVAAFAAHRGMPLHAHVSEQPAENEQCLAAHGLTPVQLLAEQGALGADFTAVHATHLTDTDVALLASHRCVVCMCPTTERDLADGIGPAARLATAGARLSLGSDSHAVIDLFEEARAVELDERLATNVRGNHGAVALMRAATFDGHASLGRRGAGRLAVGAPADLVAVSLQSVRTAGATPQTALESVVFAASAADVTTVVVAGEVLVDGGRHVRFDVASALADSITAVREAAAGGLS